MRWLPMWLPWYVALSQRMKPPPLLCAAKDASAKLSIICREKKSGEKMGQGSSTAFNIAALTVPEVGA